MTVLETLNIQNLTSYLSDIGIVAIFLLGYLIISYFNKQTSEKEKVNEKEYKTIKEFNDFIKDNINSPATSILKEISTLKLVPNIQTYNLILNAYVNKKCFDDLNIISEVVMDSMGPVKPNINTLNILIKALSLQLESVVLESNEVEELVNKMKYFLEKFNNIDYDIVTYNTIIDFLVKTSNSDHINYAWKLFENINNIESELKPDKYTYSSLIKSLKVYNTDSELIQNRFMKCCEILTILEEERKTGNLKNNNENERQFLNDNSSDNEVIFNSLIDSSYKIGNIEKANYLFKLMKSYVLPSKITYSTIIKGLGQHYMLKEALEIFEEMKLNLIAPNEITYGCLLNAAVRCCNISKATEIYRDMLNENIPMNTVLYTTLIKAYTKSKDLKSALDVYSTMIKDNKINIVSINSILDCCVECFNINKMNEIYQDLKNNYENSSSKDAIKPDLITYSTVIKGYSKVKNIDKVLEIYDFLIKNNDIYKVDEVTYNTVIDACVKNGLYDKACLIHENMIKDGVAKGKVTYCILMKLCIAQGKFENAMKLLDEMKDKNITPGVIVYTCLIQAAFRNNLPKVAIDLFEEMKIISSPDHVIYNIVINGCLYHRINEKAAFFVNESLDKNIKIATDIYTNTLFKISKYSRHLSQDNKQIVSLILTKLKMKGIFIDNELYRSITKLIYNK